MKRLSRLVYAIVVFLVLGLGIVTVKSHAAETMVIEAVVSPSTLILSSSGVWVSVHTDISYGAVAKMSLTLNGIEVAWTKSDAQGNLVAKFNLDDVKNIVQPPSAELVMTGLTVDGVPFVGMDTVSVSAGTKK